MSDRLDQLMKLYAADEKDPFLTYGIAMEHSKVGRFDEAIAWFDRTLVLDAHYCYAYYQKAIALQHRAGDGDIDAARDVIQQGIGAARSSGDGKALGELEELLGML